MFIIIIVFFQILREHGSDIKKNQTFQSATPVIKNTKRIRKCQGIS